MGTHPSQVRLEQDFYGRSNSQKLPGTSQQVLDEARLEVVGSFLPVLDVPDPQLARRREDCFRRQKTRILNYLTLDEFFG